MTGIVIGVDGSEGAASALRFAAREAQLHGWDMTAVLAWGFLSQYQNDLAAQFDPDYSQHEAGDALRSYLERALGPDCAATIERRAVCDLPTGAPLDATGDADLLVVGARGLGGFKALLLGSVSQHCLHHTTCPIAIVRAVDRPTGAETTMERIVVGVDGSRTSRQALRWAVEEARLRQASLQVVDGVDPSGLPQPIERIAYLGNAASGIIATAKGAALVVIGSRGLGGFSRLLLGSVGHHLAHHAPCPVVIIPPGD